jgi:excisionase family DNA binding protein
MKRALANHETDDEIMTVPTLADYLRCSQSMIYRLLKKRKIPALRLGSDWRFLRSDIDEWIATQYDTTSPPVTPRGRGRKRGPKPKLS